MLCRFIHHRSRLLRTVAAAAALFTARDGFAAENRPTAEQFSREIRPLLERYCTSCHDPETKKGELDLERFRSLSDVWREAELWQHVAEQVSLGEMPPAEKRQPSAEERAKLLAWIERTLSEVAEARAGDPGPVVLRRLNNAEYTYTLRDLTGVLTLDPAQEFPTDSAAGEGFMNTGGSLVMSPALLQKYLDAAKKIAEHAVLTPEGFRFSEKTTRRDQAEELLGRIRDIYANYTAASGAEKVNLQGIVFDTNEGGRLPLRKYLEATLEDREMLQRGAFQTIAGERRLSEKYLRTLWHALNWPTESPLLQPLRKLWFDANPSDLEAIVIEIGKWQKALWKFSTVGHIGKAGGPKAWMDPVTPSIEELQKSFPEGAALLENATAEQRRTAFAEFRSLFPPALCYPKIVPVDEVVTLTLAHREDEHLKRLMLDDAEARLLDELWNEYHFVSQNALLLVDAFEQLWQYATQDADPKVFEPMRQPIAERAAAFRAELSQSEPKQLDALVKFARKAYRRNLSPEEDGNLRGLYLKLRGEGIGHEEAFRNLLARIFVSPNFLYRLEQAPTAAKSAPVHDVELATRLSYFLWSSTPDETLRELANNGELRRPEVLEAQVTRLLQDTRASRLAKEFGLAWLHLYDFEGLDEKSERHFPEFARLKSAMQSEVLSFFTDLFQNDRSPLNIIDADYTFVNEPLARHYGIDGVSGDSFRRVDGVKKHSRGGVLGMAATLAKQSGASRTSPILRGTWISEVMLGEKLPKPPKGVPPLPEDAASETLTMREIVVKHTSDPRCANCHSRIDGYGFAMEQFDAIGRLRDSDAGQPLVTKSKLHDGTEVNGFEDLRDYLSDARRNAFVQQFCRKLLGYALGRSVLLSDRPLIAEMQSELEKNGYRFSVAVKTIVKSKQFREIRGKEAEQLAAN